MGKAGPTGGGATTEISWGLFAEPDLDFLFPKDVGTPIARRALDVVD
jgi:hypothetical protein